MTRQTHTGHGVRRLVRKRRPAAGSPPGTLALPAKPGGTSIRVMRYDPAGAEEFDARSDDLASIIQPGKVAWIDVQGLGDESLLRRLAEVFGIHPLALADIVNIGQRPKSEDYDGRLFVVVRMVRMPAPDTPDWEQVSLWAGPGFVVTFQEKPGDCLDPLRGRIRTDGSRLRSSDAGYLATMVVDAIVDAYFPALESFGEHLDTIERRLIDRPDADLLTTIFHTKRELMGFRRAIWPQRETLTRLLRDGHPLITPATTPYLRDVYDHAVHLADVTETYRELAQSYIDVYLSSVAHRTNETMRVLTVLATIFIPLTFVAGVFGMNFDTSHPLNMPELGWRFGYPAFWVFCVVLAGSMLYVARRAGWIGGGKNNP